MGVTAVPDGKDHDVPFVALHALQIFDEEPVQSVLGKGSGRLRRAASTASWITTACDWDSATTPSDLPLRVLKWWITRRATSSASPGLFRAAAPER